MLQSLIIVGGGPGALAPLFAAASNGTLETLLATGVTVIERSHELGPGGLSNITINSDSPAEAFLEILQRSQEPALRELLDHPTAKEIERQRGSSIPLPLAADLLRLASRKILEIVTSHPNCAVQMDTEVHFIQRIPGGSWKVACRDLGGSATERHSHSVHLATGAHQPLARLAGEPVAGMPLLPKYESKIIQSGELFTAAGAEQLTRKLKGISSPKIVIIGGSASAGAAATYLLRHTEVSLDAGGLTFLHRNPLRLFYQSTEEAHQDGYRDFTKEDVCNISGRVFRLSGFRFESKELLRNAVLGNVSAADARLRLFPMAGRDEEAQKLLEDADVIIAALGYIPRMCEVRDELGDPIPLHTPTRDRWSMVDHTCTVLTGDGKRLNGVTAMGLAIGPEASPESGGEANFKGQVNSLWLWQNHLGARVVEGVIRRNRQRIPLIRPAPPRLSQHRERFLAIEASNVYSNLGPENTRFERSLLQSFFHGQGACLTTCNATLALMLAIKNAVGDFPRRKRYALMPSFTFAAAAQAALWCGLTPLFCDISPRTWLPCQNSEQSLLQLFGGQIAVIVPNATFGNNLDLRRYEALQLETGIPVVVDAAASLGSMDHEGLPFGTGSTLPIVFSMHATKNFATGEGGVVYSADTDLIDRLRCMSCFGFNSSRNVVALGLNAKLSEVGALTASLQLETFAQQLLERESITSWYAHALQPQFSLQILNGRRQVPAFLSILLPRSGASRHIVQKRLEESGIQTGNYFSPHLAQQKFFRERSECPRLPVSDDISARILSLPLFLGMTHTQVECVTHTLAEIWQAHSSDPLAPLEQES